MNSIRTSVSEANTCKFIYNTYAQGWALFWIFPKSVILNKGPNLISRWNLYTYSRYICSHACKHSCFCIQIIQSCTNFLFIIFLKRGKNTKFLLATHSLKVWFLLICWVLCFHYWRKLTSIRKKKKFLKMENEQNSWKCIRAHTLNQ